MKNDQDTNSSGTSSDNFTDSELQEFYNSASKSGGQIDLNSREGRALKNAGWVDDKGYGIKGKTGEGDSPGSSRR
jgi:hypothetical protein